MMRAIRAVSTLRGRDPRDFTLLAYGGAGPIHAATLARELEIKRILIPPMAGVFSSFGLLFATIEHHASESFFHRLDESVVERANKTWSKMQSEIMAEIEAAHYGEDVIVEITKSVDARYTGQSSELTLTVAGDTLKPEHIPQLVRNFNEEHLKSYAHKRADEPVDMVNLRLMVRVIFPTEVDLGRLFDSGVGITTVSRKRTRKVN